MQEEGLGSLYRDGCAFTTPDIDRRDPAFQVALFEGVRERHNDPRTGCAKRVAQRAGTAVRIHAVTRHTKVMHKGHRHDGKCLVHLPQIDILKGSSDFV